MYEQELLEIRRYHDLKGISDAELLPYFEMATTELLDMQIKDSMQSKALCFMTLLLLGQKLWHKIQQRANQYDETLETYKDVEKWEAYWRERLSTLTIKKTPLSGFNFGAV